MGRPLSRAFFWKFCGGFFSGERFKKHEIDHRFGGQFGIFYCVGGHLNGHFFGFFKRSPLQNPQLVVLPFWVRRRSDIEIHP